MERYIKASDVYKLFKENGTANLHVSDIDKLPQVPLMKPTNYDWIRHMSVNALAKFLHDITNACSESGYHGNSVYEYDGKQCSYCTEMLDCPMSKSCESYIKANPNVKKLGLNARCTEESIKQWLNEDSSEVEKDEL